MKSTKRLLPLVAALSLSFAALAASPVTTVPERYLHVKVNDASTHELVRVNVPLSLAEKVVPAINQEQLRNGKVKIGKISANLDIKAILNALKTAPEGEFVTVQDASDNVHVAKENACIVVHVADSKSKENVDVTIPWAVAEALTSDISQDQLNLQAGIQALKTTGDMTLVSVTSKNESVRIWVDSNNASE